MLTEIEKYLGSGLIKGVGSVTAKQIVAHCALETLEIIEQHSDRLIEVPGIGKKRVRMIQKAWRTKPSIVTRPPIYKGNSRSLENHLRLPWNCCRDLVFEREVSPIRTLFVPSDRGFYRTR